MQFGFRKNISTNDELNFINNKIYNNLYKGIKTIATFLDLSKAFDTVNHAILIKKLYRDGIRGNTLKLLENYLFNRVQMVKIGNYNSKLSRVTVGVPQGSLLGHLLFILYVNDLLELSDNNIISYADDAVVFGTGNN